MFSADQTQFSASIKKNQKQTPGPIKPYKDTKLKMKWVYSILLQEVKHGGEQSQAANAQVQHNP